MTDPASPNPQPPPPGPLPYAPSISSPVAAPASTAQVQHELAAARVAAKKVRRTAAYAIFDAWTIAIFAGISFICGVSSDISGVIMGLCMGLIAYVEFTGAAQVRRLDPDAAKRLGYNQLAFGALIMLYGFWMMHGSSSGLDSIKQQLADAGTSSQQVDDWMRTIHNLVIALIVAIPVLAMGGTALFYFSREKHIRQYIQNTAPWIVEMQRSGGPL
jgi:hypothetical protein